MTNPTPMPVGWWLHSSRRAMLVVFDERSIDEESNAPILAYTSKGNYNWFAPDSFIHTLPEDAGFDWKPEPDVVFPVWLAPAIDENITSRNKRVAYFRFDSNETGETFCTDGTSLKFSGADLENECDVGPVITQAEAEARIVKPAPQYPEYWTPHLDDRYAYLRRDSDTTHVCVDLDGTESNPCDWSAIVHDGRTRLTKAEAEARVVRRKSIPEQCPDRWFIWSDDRYPIAFVKHASGQVFNLNVDSVLKQSDDWHQGYVDQLTKGELVEVTEFSAKAYLKRQRSASQIQKSAEPDPEEWVTQDRVPDRTGIDQWRWVSKKNGTACQWYDSEQNFSYMHGHEDKDEFFEVRCRRKDLPPFPEQPSKPNRIPVRLYWYDGNVVARYGHTPPADPSFVEIKLDPERHISDSGFYIEGTGT